MDVKNWITQVTAEQRQDMIQKGLSPLVPSHVQRYLKEGGRVQATQQSKIERARSLIGEENINISLGSGKEKEMSLSVKDGKVSSASYDIDELANSDIVIEKTDFTSGKTREQMLGDYGSRTNSSNLLSLKEEIGNGIPKSGNKTNLSQYQDLGYKNTIKYLNDFILSLKSPSTQTRLTVFNSLKTVLQTENSLKDNKQALQAYRNGCVQAEQSMYTKLTN